MDDIFDKIYYINLDRRGDRNEEFLRDVGKYIPAERVSAIDGRDIERGKAPRDPLLREFMNKCISTLEKTELKDREHKSPIRYGEVGLSLTYYWLWREIAEDSTLSDDCFILTLEDDVKLCDHFFPTLRTQKQQLLTNKHTLGVIYLGGRRQAEGFIPPTQVLRNYVPFPQVSARGQLFLRPVETEKGYWYDRETHALAYTKRTVKEILRKVDSYFLLKPIDLFLTSLSRRGVTFSEIFPHPCYSCERGDTDIQRSGNIPANIY